jgi:hypothetical protein
MADREAARTASRDAPIIGRQRLGGSHDSFAGIGRQIGYEKCGQQLNIGPRGQREIGKFRAIAHDVDA